MKKKNKSEERDSELVIDKFAGSNAIDSSNVFTICYTFKSEPAYMLKNISPFKNDPMMNSIIHSHIYHSFDSNGKEQKNTNAVGGHYHEIKLDRVNDEWVVTCSTPKSERVSNELIANDNHTHEFIHIKTRKVSIRKINEEAMKMINAAMAKESV